MSTSSQDLPPKDKALISQSCSRRSVAERGREHRLVEHGQIQPRAKHLQDAAPLPAEKHDLAAPSLGPKAPTAPRGLGSARIPHPIHRHTTACPFPPPGSRIHPSDTKIFHIGAWSFENDPSPSSAAPCSLGRAPVPCAGHPGMFLWARAVCTSQLWMRTVLDSDGSLPVGGPTARSNSRMPKAVIGGPEPGAGNGSREGAHQCSSASSQGVQGAADMHKHQIVSKKGSFLDEFISTWLYACPFQPLVEAVPCGATNRFWGQQPGKKRHKKW